MITLKQLSITNFLSHSKTEIEFRPDQKILISGKSGSGKSSIIEAIVWCLFNKARADNRSLIKRGTTRASVTVILQDDSGITYKIVRSISKANKHEFNVFEGQGKALKLVKTAGVKDTQEHLENKILHASYLLFVNSIFYLQENQDSFAKQNASKKKDIILEIIGAGDYDEYFKKAKEKLQEAKINHEIVSSKLNDRKLQIDDVSAIANKLSVYKKEAERINGELEQANAVLKVLKEANKEIEEKLVQISVKEARLFEVIASIDDLNVRIQTLNQKIISLDSIDVESLKIKVDELNAKKEELLALEGKQKKVLEWNKQMTTIIQSTPIVQDYDSYIKEINDRIIEVMKEKIELCPELNKVCPILERKQDENVKSLETQINDLQMKDMDQKRQKDIHTQKMEAIGISPKDCSAEIEKVKQDISNLEPYQLKLAEADAKKETISEYADEIEKLTNDSKVLIDEKTAIKKAVEESNAGKLREELAENNLMISKQDSDIIRLTNQNMENHGNLMMAEQASIKIDGYKEELKELSAKMDIIKEDTESLKLIKDAFGLNGVRAIMIDYLLPELEDKINDVLGKLSDFRVRIDTQKSGVGEDVTIEGLFINIINGQGEEFDFSSFSGGEHVKISIAINEALAALSKINFRIFDEAIVSLDNESTQKFLSAIVEIQQQVSQVICISHIPEVQEIFEEKIIVQKVNGDSKIL